jgi:hypothetical protein
MQRRTHRYRRAWAPTHGTPGHIDATVASNLWTYVDPGRSWAILRHGTLLAIPDGLTRLSDICRATMATLHEFTSAAEPDHTPRVQTLNSEWVQTALAGYLPADQDIHIVSFGSRARVAVALARGTPNSGLRATACAVRTVCADAVDTNNHPIGVNIIVRRGV